MPPFHATTFQSGASRNATRAGLDVLQKCAHCLLYELKMESLATGLDVFVEVQFAESPLTTSYSLQPRSPVSLRHCSLMCIVYIGSNKLPTQEELSKLA